MRIDIVTLFPAMLAGPFDHSIVARARARGLLDLRVHDLRAWTTDRHRTADDAPFGGGIGMILKPEPFFRAVEALRAADLPASRTRVVLLSAAGWLFDDGVARELAALDQLILLCGHYEGIDERVAAHLADSELSIGDFVLTGGELAAMVVADAVCRYVPGVLEQEATTAESYATGLLEHPHYTRPADFRGWQVPGILLAGDHAAVARWRRQQALLCTWQRRPELLQRAALSAEDRALLAEALSQYRAREQPLPSRRPSPTGREGTEEPSPRERGGAERPRGRGWQRAALAGEGPPGQAVSPLEVPAGAPTLPAVRQRAAPRPSRLSTLRRRHPGAWLLVHVTREAAGRPAAGIVLAHSHDKEVVLAAAAQARALDSAALLYLLAADAEAGDAL